MENAVDREKAISELETMKELIKATKNMFEIGFPNVVSDVYDNALDTISDAIALLKAPIRHGRWKEVDSSGENSVLRECSACGEWVLCEYGFVPKYCPECGARMNEGEADV